MEGYRILLVDDEEELRAGIRRRIDWEALGFVLAGKPPTGRTRWSWPSSCGRTWCSPTSRCPLWTGSPSAAA